MENKNISYKKYLIKLIMLIVVDIAILLITMFNFKAVKTLNPSIIALLVVVSIILIILSSVSKLYGKKEIISYIFYQIVDLYYLVMLAVVFVQVVFITLFFPAQVSGPSMNDTLVNGQFVLCQSNTKNINDGDILVIYCNEDVASKSGTLNEGEYLVKRVVASYGDVVKLDRETNTLYVNGKAICGINNNVLESEFTVEFGKYFVVGDNYLNSYDSRSFGLIDQDDVIGIVKYKSNSIFNWEKVK